MATEVVQSKEKIGDIIEKIRPLMIKELGLVGTFMKDDNGRLLLLFEEVLYNGPTAQKIVEVLEGVGYKVTIRPAKQRLHR